MFVAGSDAVKYATQAASASVFPHIPGYDVTAIIPVTMEVQVVVAHCEICQSSMQDMQVLCRYGHEMCWDCLGGWTAKGGASCPYCREPLLATAPTQGGVYLRPEFDRCMYIIPFTRGPE